MRNPMFDSVINDWQVISSDLEWQDFLLIDEGDALLDFPD